MLWKMRNGESIEMSDMSDYHLDNTVAMLERAGFVTINAYLDCLAYSCAGDTPDGAQMAAESEVDRMQTNPAYEALLDEKERRCKA